MTILFDEINDDMGSTSSPLGVVNVPKRAGLYRNWLKRVLDLLLITIAAPVIIPVIFVLALIVWRDGHNPFYPSTRVGKFGKNFRMLKLRTMVPDAKILLDRHLAENAGARDEWTQNQKLKNDPRTTQFGKFLRKTSLDELPQLWNVILGDMSLVGPRPMLPEQRAMYPGLSYYALRPGITGMWQVSDRNEVEFARRADFDRKYEINLSFSLDVRLLLRTISVVLKGTGY